MNCVFATGSLFVLVVPLVAINYNTRLERHFRQLTRPFVSRLLFTLHAYEQRLHSVPLHQLGAKPIYKTPASYLDDKRSLRV